MSQFEQLDALGPLDLGPLLRVDTTTDVDVEDLARAIRSAAG